jgi:ABC-type microcin C transport system permease subunit YejB
MQRLFVYVKNYSETMDYDQYRGSGSEFLNFISTQIWTPKVPFSRYCLVCQMFDNMDGFENLYDSSKILNYIVTRKTADIFKGQWKWRVL